jgi:hypothetical protein
MNPEINAPAAIYGVLKTMVRSKLRGMYPEGNVSRRESRHCELLAHSSQLERVMITQILWIQY